MSETILEAYCVELGKVIDIEEAQDAFFEQSMPRKRFTFLCSDEACRSLPVKPEIVGVNYDKDTCKIAPHFRRHKKHIHAPSCQWGQYNTTLEELLSNKKVYRKKYCKNIFFDFEKVDAIDVFDELYQARESTEERQYMSSSHTVDDIKHDIIHKHRKTRSLDKVVDTFRRLTDSEKLLASLTLPNTRRLSYDKSFKCVSEIRHFFTWTHIYYGKARVYKYSKNFQGYKIFFTSAYCAYNENINIDTTYDVFLSISDKDITNSRQHQQLKKDLDTYVKSKEYCCCYVLANVTHLQNSELFFDGGQRIDSIEIEHGLDIVLRSISPKCR